MKKTSRGLGGGEGLAELGDGLEGLALGGAFGDAELPAGLGVGAAFDADEAQDGDLSGRARLEVRDRFVHLPPEHGLVGERRGADRFGGALGIGHRDRPALGAALAADRLVDEDGPEPGSGEPDLARRPGSGALDPDILEQVFDLVRISPEEAFGEARELRQIGVVELRETAVGGASGHRRLLS